MQNRSIEPPARDINQIAAAIVAQASEPTAPAKEKNPAAVALGRLGGLKGGRARADRLTANQRKEIASKAARARWGKEFPPE
jgi:hypothetical protein